MKLMGLGNGARNSIHIKMIKEKNMNFDTTMNCPLCNCDKIITYKIPYLDESDNGTKVIVIPVISECGCEWELHHVIDKENGKNNSTVSIIKNCEHQPQDKESNKSSVIKLNEYTESSKHWIPEDIISVVKKRIETGELKNFGKAIVILLDDDNDDYHYHAFNSRLSTNEAIALLEIVKADMIKNLI